MDEQAFVRNTPTNGKDDVLASEAATYAYCAKAWHLEYALHRAASENAVERRAEGAARHEEHGANVGTLRRVGSRLLLLSLALLGLAAVLLVLGLLANG